MYNEADIDEAGDYFNTLSHVGGLIGLGPISPAMMPSPIHFKTREDLYPLPFWSFLVEYVAKKDIGRRAARIAVLRTWDPPPPRRFLLWIRPRDPPWPLDEEDDDYGEDDDA